MRHAHVIKCAERLSQWVRDARRRVLFIVVVWALGVPFVVVPLRGREVVRKVVKELVVGVAGVESLHIYPVAVDASINYVVRSSIGLIVRVCIAVLVDACVLAIRARVCRGVRRVVLLDFIFVVPARLLGAVSSTIAAICLWLEKLCDTTGLLVRWSEGMRILVVPVVLVVVVFALSTSDKDLIGGLRVDEVGCIDLLTRHSLVGMVLEGQLAVGFLDGGGISFVVDTKDGVVIDESSHSHWLRQKYKVKDTVKKLSLWPD